VDASGAYQLAVSKTLPGESYTLRIVTKDLTLSPPQTFKLEVPADVNFDLVVDDPQDLLELIGTVHDVLQNPIASLQIAAVDPTTHAPLSTIAVTDKSGSFALRVSPRAPSGLVLTATPVASQVGQLPSLSMPIDISKPGRANSLTYDLMLPPFP